LFDGDISHVLITNDVLTATEISQIYEYWENGTQFWSTGDKVFPENPSSPLFPKF